MPTSNRSAFPLCLERVSATSRTAVYGPVRTVVWEGRSREAPPIPGHSLHMTTCRGTNDDQSIEMAGLIFKAAIVSMAASMAIWRRRIALELRVSTSRTAARLDLGNKLLKH